MSGPRGDGPTSRSTRIEGRAGELLRVFGALCVDQIASGDQTQRKVLQQPANGLYPRAPLDDLLQLRTQLRVLFMQRSDRFLISARVRMPLDHPHELSELVQR